MHYRTHRKGTILVVALGLLAALAIVGATLISLARMDRFASRNFRQSAEVDLAVEAAMTWLEAEIANHYWNHNFWAEASGATDTTYTTKTGVVDGPQKFTPGTRIAIVRPDEDGVIVNMPGDPTKPGLYCASGSGSDLWHVLPVMENLPDPGKPDKINNNVGDAWHGSELRFRASANRTIEIALTMVDLGGRYNLNFHGDGRLDMSGGNGGQSYEPTEGFLITDIAPDYVIYSNDSAGRTALSERDQRSYRNVIRGIGASRGRWGSRMAPITNADMTLNFFNPGDDRPYLADDLIELLLLRGTGRQNRLERILPNSLSRDGEVGLNQGDVDPMFYKALYTTHSWVSACRPRRTNESRMSKDLYVKADLDASTEEQLEEALLATGIFDDTTKDVEEGKFNLKDLKQILANIIDFRDKDHKPTAIAVGDGHVYGVDRQPFLTEVYFKKLKPPNPDNPPDYVDFEVTVEMCNPYDTPIKRGEAYTRLSVGKKTPGTDPPGTPLSLPESIAAKPEDGSKPVSIENATGTIRVPRDEDPIDYLEPVLLFTKSKGSVTKQILIDRITFENLPGQGESWQRLNRTGQDREGNDAEFFGGWTAATSELVQAAQTCSGGRGERFNTPTDDKVCKPIENRSLTEEPKDREKRRYEPDELSFRCIGDLIRVLRIGHEVGEDEDDDSSGDSSYDNDKPVTEALAEDDEEDTHLNPMDNLYKRVFRVFTVNSPYCDGIDNDSDLIDKNNNNIIDGDEKGYDDTDTGFQFQTTDSGLEVPVDVLGPEIYQHGRINLMTAPPEVIRGLLPLQLKRRNVSMWRSARDICNTSKNLRSPEDLLNQYVHRYSKGKDVFADPEDFDNWDDDGNGAPDDFGDVCYLYTYMSNWATTRSDCFAVYGVARIQSAAGRTEGMRRFLTVLDRVPATAYPPFVWVDKDNTDNLKPNPRFIPVRRVFTTWIN